MRFKLANRPLATFVIMVILLIVMFFHANYSRQQQRKENAPYIDLRGRFKKKSAYQYYRRIQNL